MKRFVVGLVLSLAMTSAHAQDEKSWANNVRMAAGESPIALFNGRDLEGWDGQIDEYWSVEEGVIVGRNDHAVPASTYLLTEKSYRNFRLLFEVKQTIGARYSTMHSAVCCLGEVIEDNGRKFGFRGPLLMFCHDWGIWDAHRRNRVFPEAHKGTWRHGAEKTGDWNQIEVLVIGDHIQMVNNGQLVIDMRDQPNMLQASPIGLQLHRNGKPQEYRFRGLVLVDDPQDNLVTLSPP